MSAIPSRGDVILLSLDPTLGHEQAGRRPAVVLSPDFYNKASGLCLVCPITTQIKGYPFEVPLAGTRKPPVSLLPTKFGPSTGRPGK